MTDTIEAVARAIANASAEAWENWGIGTDPADWRDEAEAAIKALIEGAGDVERKLMAGDLCSVELAPKAAATIAAMKAEIERLTEREAQAKLDGVKAGIEASAVQCEWPPEAPVKVEYQRGLMTGCILCERAIRALDAQAITKGEG